MKIFKCFNQNLDQCLSIRLVVQNHRRSMEKEAKAIRRRCFMGENCCTHASIQTVLQTS